MKIRDGIGLDFDDVLIVPKRSNIQSRSQVDLTRDYKFINSENTINVGVPIIAANMDTIGTFAMARALAKHNIWTALHKFYSVEELFKFFSEEKYVCERVFYSMGITDNDLEKIKKLTDMGVEFKNICIDVANGYTQQFVERCFKIRELYSKSVILAGNVCTGEMVQELLINGKVDIVKVGIGGGCFVAGTKVKIENGYKKIEKIEIGDKVYTHLGNLKTVVGKMVRKEKRTIISVNGINCTQNHEFYVIEKKDKHLINKENIHKYAKWISAQELNEKYLLIKLTN
jgi:GMP reductase